MYLVVFICIWLTEKMKAIDVYWTKNVNMLKVQCDCGKVFQHRLDRWKVVCPACSAIENVDKLRNEFCMMEAKTNQPATILYKHGDLAYCPTCGALGQIDLDCKTDIPCFENSIWWNSDDNIWECFECCWK